MKKLIDEHKIKKIVSENISKLIKEEVNKEVASTILQQLGGHKFIVMTGAKDFVAIDNGLQFRIGRNASRANKVRILLKGDDTYTMQFWKISNSNPYKYTYDMLKKGISPEEAKKKAEQAELRAQPKMLKEYTGLYFDQLQEFFTEFTKLYTHL